MPSKPSKNIYGVIPLIIFLVVFISGCVQPQSTTLTRPSDNGITEHVNESKLKPEDYNPNCHPTSSAGEIIGTGKGWVRLLGGPNISLLSIVLSPVQQTSDGGYITVGYTDDRAGGPYYVYLLKVDANGNQWNKTYGMGAGFSVKQTSDGGYIITVERAKDAGGSYLIKTDADGNMQWNKAFELCSGRVSDRGYSIQQTIDGGYIIAGQTSNCDFFGSHDGFLLKVDANGNKIWEKAFGGNKSDSLFSAYQTSDGGYIAFGYTKSFSKGSIFPEWTNVSLSPTEFYLIKTDADGNMILNKTFGEYDSDAGYLVEQTSDGGYVVSRGEYVFKLDENGNRLWNKAFEFIHNSCRESYGSIYSPFHQTSDGGFVAVAEGGAEEQNRSSIKLVKFDENGNMIWYKNVFVGGIGMQTSSVKQTSDGGYIITGRLDTIVTKSVYYDYLIKTDENGNV